MVLIYYYIKVETTLKEITFFSFFILLLTSLLASIYLIDYRHSKRLRQQQPTGEVCSDDIKSAMRKMGPKYNYMMKGEKLYVDRGDGRWLRLYYKKTKGE